MRLGVVGGESMDAGVTRGSDDGPQQSAQSADEYALTYINVKINFYF